MERLGITCKFQIPGDRFGIDALLMVPEQLPKIICYGYFKPKRKKTVGSDMHRGN